MAYVTLEDLGVASGTICMPLVGAWHADLLVDTRDELEGEVVIRCGDQMELKGTVNRFLKYAGMAQVRVLAGADGLRKPATPRYYRNPTIGNVLQALAEDAGEEVSATADAATLATVIPAWTTIAVTVGQMLGALTQAVAWRMLPDGSLWVGPETWIESGVQEWIELSEDGLNMAVEFGTVGAGIAPGTVIAERRVGYVEHKIDSGSIRSVVWAVP